MVAPFLSLHSAAVRCTLYCAALHPPLVSDTQTATCSPTEIHGGGVVSVVEDAGDKPTALGAVGAARVSTAVAASTGAPLLTPDRGASSWCTVGVWSKWTKCAGCGFVLQRRERSVSYLYSSRSAFIKISTAAEGTQCKLALCECASVSVSVSVSAWLAHDSQTQDH